MTDGLIPHRNSSKEYYSNLLLKRDAVSKEALNYSIEYNVMFGDIIISIFEMKIECVRKKKTISYYQRAINLGGKVNSAEFQKYIKQQMADYEANLKSMIEHNNAIKETTHISEYDVQKIKKLYHKIAKQIHPDMNPQLKDIITIQELWQRVVTAYKLNQLKELEELEVLVSVALSEHDINTEDVIVPYLEDKIAELEKEIDKITSTDPYLYKFLLADVDMVSLKEKELNEELESFTKYAAQLEEVIQQMLTSGEVTIWTTT